MENHPSNSKAIEKKSPGTTDQFTWTIKNFSQCDSKTYSESFFLKGYPWRIVMNPKGSKNNPGYLSLSIYLNVGDNFNLPKGWSRYVNLELALANQVNALLTIAKETEQEFKESSYYWSVDKFVHLDALRNSWSGYVLNDTCIIKARIISVREQGYGSVNDQEVSAVDSSPAQPIPVKEISSASSCDNLVDFKGIGKVDKKFVPLLEEVCSWHPSLVDNQTKRKRTHRFTEWAFTALGRVLYFLNTKKVKDMNEDACDRLQILWEELETVGFDLSWLKPSYLSAMRTKNYVQREANVKKLKKNVELIERDLATAFGC